MRTSKKQTGIKPKKTKGKRVSLRCPLSVERTDLEYNFDTNALQVCMTVENIGGGGLASDTIESAVIVVRLFDKEGKLIPCGENEYFAKLLKFGEDGLENGERITFRLIPDCGGAGTRTEDVEIYISRIRYTDSTVTDYVRGDFFDLPGDGVLLTKKFKKNAAVAEGMLGAGAKYVPEHLTEIVWRCACGEFSESDTCPICKRNKAALFAALDDLIAPKSRKVVAPIPVGGGEKSQSESTSAQGEGNPSQTDDNTAEYSVSSAIAAANQMKEGNPDKTDADGSEDEGGVPPVLPPENGDAESPDKVRTILLTAISAAAVVLLIIILLLILTLCGKRGAAESTTTTTDTPVTEPAPQDYNESIVRSYLAQKDFDNALGYALQAGCEQELIDEIYTSAIDYYTGTGNLNKALDFATRKGDTALVESINLLLFSQKISAGDYMGALAMVDKLPAEQQESAKDQATEGYVQSLIKEEKYTEAMEAADQYQTTTTSKQIAETLIGKYLEDKKFDDAIKLAEEKNLPEQVVTAAAAATDYYKDLGNYDLAADYVVLTGSESRMQEILQKLTDSQLRKHLPAFFPLLSVDRMQAVHASPLSTMPRDIAVIDVEGNVFLGGEMIYSIEDTGIPAISVSCCDTSVVILLSNGSVQIAKDNNTSYSAEDVKKWTNVVAIAAGNNHLLALTKDGKVLSAGNNDNGQCDTADIKNAVAVAVGDYHSLILLSDGTVTALGKNTANVCNTESWSDIVAIAAGTMHSIGLKKDGTVVALGNCDVDGWTNVVSIFSYARTAVALKADGTLFCDIDGKPSEVVSAVQYVLWVSAGNGSVVVLYKDGTLAVYGNTAANTDLLAGIPIKTDVFGIE